MLIDLTIKITPNTTKGVTSNLNSGLNGHVGTHFDVMDKEFPIEFTRRDGIVFDVSKIENNEVQVKNIQIEKIRENMFVGFYTGHINKEEYGTEGYFKNHPVLSNELIKILLEKRISIIGIDAAGIRSGKEHGPADKLCADNNVFVVENLCNLEKVLEISPRFVANTYPLNYEGLTGLPCRVIACVENKNYNDNNVGELLGKIKL